MAKTKSTLNLSDVVLDVKVTRTKIGTGTFVHVFKAQYNKTIFAAKEYVYSDTTVSRDSGFDLEGNPRNDHAIKLLKECQRCMKLGHQNVIRLVGLHYGAPAVPVLIVEKLRETLKYFLENNEDVEPACKLSILLDVAEGLRYLHSQDPQIACGCLTSKDILLTDQRRAKIAGDFHITRLLKQFSMRRNQKADLKKGNPDDFLPHGVKLGTLHPSLDVFSYGGVMLHVITQTWPKPENASAAGKPITISEVDRRSKYIKAVDHHLKVLIKCCLDDDPRARPKIGQVRADLQNIVAQEETSQIAETELSTKATKMIRQV